MHTHQTGMSKWSWLLVIIGIVFAATTAMRLGPHYLDFRIVQGVADRLPPGEVHGKMSKNEIREHFRRQFRVENFGVPVKEMMKITREQHQTILDIHYEIREHLVYNIEVVLVFSDQRTFQ